MIGNIIHAVDDYCYMFLDLFLIMVIFTVVYGRRILTKHPLLYWVSVLLLALLFRYLYYFLMGLFENRFSIREADDVFPVQYTSYIRPLLQLFFALIFGRLLTCGRMVHLFVISLYYISISQMLHVVDYNLSRLWPKDLLASWNMVYIIRAIGILVFSLILTWLMIILGKALQKYSSSLVLWGNSVCALVVYIIITCGESRIDSISLLGFVYMIVCIITVLLILLYSEISRNRQAASKLLFHKEIENSYRQYTFELDHMAREIRIFRHEFQSRLLQLETLLDEKKYNELKEQLDGMLESIPTNEQLVTTGSHDFDVIVNRKFQEAKAKGVALQAHISIPQSLPLTTEDLFSLISNVCNNAIEAAVLTEKPQLSFSARAVKNYLVIIVRNSCTEDAMKTNPELHTTKENSAFHGYGIPVMQMIAEKYNGSVTFSTSEEGFQTKILLSLDPAV